MNKNKLFTRGKEAPKKATTPRKKYTKEVDTTTRAYELEEAMRNHFRRFHSLNEINDKEIEMQVLEYEMKAITDPKPLHFERMTTFSPSSASKCDRELYFKATKAPKDEIQMRPYQRRWVRNGSAIHAAVQKDLLLAEAHLRNPAFKVARMEDGTPAWERFLMDVKQFQHCGMNFQVFGMMDGILEYEDGSRIGFEFKTKSTTIAAVGDYKMKDAQEDHKQQAIAYSLLFGVDEFLFVYESLAKDGWTKNDDARDDIRVFYYKPTQEEKEALLDKFARIAAQVYGKAVPEPNFDKCLFCPFKSVCQRYEDGLI